MKKLLALFLLLSVATVFADQAVGIETEKSCLTYPADFKATIINYQDKTDTFGFSILGPYSSWVTYNDRFVTLPQGKKGTISLSIIPPKNIANGFYNFEVYSYSTTDNSIKAFGNICMAVIENFRAGIKTVETAGEVIPGQAIPLFVTVNNFGSRSMDNVKLDVSVSGLGKFTKSFNLADGETSVIRFDIPTADSAVPGKYDASVSMEFRGTKVSESKASFSIKEINEIAKTETKKWSPIADFRTINVKNIGNVVASKQVEVSVPGIWSYLISAKNAQSFAAGAFTKYVWTVNLLPGESVQLFYTINYWPILLASIASFFIVSRFYFTIRNVKISKTAFDYGKEFKVALEIKNNTGRPLKNVVIRDFVPSIAKLSGFNMVRPDVLSRKNGVELEWKFDELIPGEERILTYGLMPLLGTPDYFMLPGAKISGEHEGKMFIDISDYTKLGGMPNENAGFEKKAF
ncbi:MAG: hypothetical protein HZB68_04825 [Candidatus Aenigmarchaeota archaeon]|nr:hypothetical protein [Candidatus Aenigmarchaeota archaeon]